MLMAPTHDLIRLAMRNISNRMLALLAPHKIALLAIEKQATSLAKEAVLEVNTPAQMTKAARKIIRAVRHVSAELAYRHAVKEFELLGIEDIPPMPKLDKVFFDQVMWDLAEALANPLLSHKEKARRAGIAATSMANRTYTNMQLAMYEEIAERTGRYVEKIWVTNKNAGTSPCAHCTALDGTVVRVDTDFPLPLNHLPYHDLQGPPAHPNCRCRLIPRVSGAVVHG